MDTSLTIFSNRPFHYWKGLEIRRVVGVNLFYIFLFGGGRDGAVKRAVASHQVARVRFPGPASYVCGLSLLLVLVYGPRGFSPGTPVFPSPQKPTFLNYNSTWTQWTESHPVDVPLLIPIFLVFNCSFFYFKLLKILLQLPLRSAKGWFRPNCDHFNQFAHLLGMWLSNQN